MRKARPHVGSYALEDIFTLPLEDSRLLIIMRVELRAGGVHKLVLPFYSVPL